MFATQHTFLQLTERHIKSWFSSKTLQRGKRYYEKGRVRKCVINENNQFTATVKGEYPYTVDVELDIDDDSGEVTDVFSECSCPVTHYCKHAVAVLYYIVKKQQSDAAVPSRDPVSWDNWLAQSDLQIKNNFQQQLPQKPQEKRLLFHLSITLVNHIPHIACDMFVNHHSGDLNNKQLHKLNQLHFSDLDKLNKTDLLFYWKLRDVCDNKVDKKNQQGNFVIALGTDAELLLGQLNKQIICWKQHSAKRLSKGEPKKLDYNWQADQAGVQTLHFQCEQQTIDTHYLLNTDITVLPLQPLCYYDKKTHTIGLLESKLTALEYAKLCLLPPIKPEQSQYIHKQLQQHPIAVPLPDVYPIEQLPKVKPTPILELMLVKKSELFERHRTPMFHHGSYGNDNANLPLAKLSYRYGEIDASPDLSSDNQVYQFQQNTVYSVKRHKSCEAASSKQLTKFGMIRLNQAFHHAKKTASSYYLISWPQYDDDVIEFVDNIRPALNEQGWQVTVAPDFPVQPATSVDEWYSDVNESSEYDWFSMDLGIMVDGEKVNLLPILVQLIQSQFQSLTLDEIQAIPDDRPFTLTLPSGKRVALPFVRIKTILSVLTELFGDSPLQDDGELQLSRLQAVQLAELEAQFPKASLRWLGGERLRKLGKKLQSFDKIQPVDVPTSFNGNLRPYQQEGLNWLQFLRDYQLNGVLADDMGLGKTIQTLAHLTIEKENGRLTQPCLVVAPTSLMSNWQREAEQFAPMLKVLVLHGSERQQFFGKLKEYDVILTTYPLIVRDEEVLAQHNYHYLILDEAQYVKNAKSKSYKVLHQLDANHRMCLTGTPMENHLGELWSIFHLLQPGLLGHYDQFRTLFRKPIETHADLARNQALAKRLKPFMLRRTKKDVVAELPPKNEMTRIVEIQGAQQDLYESVRLAMEQKLQQAISQKGLSKSHIVILDALLKLRQVCCDPRLLKMRSSKPVKTSAKLTLLMGMLTELIQEGRKVLLFSSFTSMLSLIAEEVAKHKIDYVKLTGQTKHRDKAINAFQDGDVPLFLISLKAGGVGLNLTAADTVIHYDPWWNPAAERQATDRAYRIGQDKPVFVYKLITKGTIEEKIQLMQQKKQALLDGLFSQTTHKKMTLSQNDLSYLLMPIGSDDEGDDNAKK